MSDAEEDIQIIDFSKEKAKRKKVVKAKTGKLIFAHKDHYDWFTKLICIIDDAADKGEEIKQKEQAKKVNLLVTEGHVSY